mmetsp:Transcript_6908/g.16597  ORF Transcript_6908/g.16597 Transcript_6908/m.16597 type:complete len:373 (-) Transcript_6908:1396-2514(-)
MTVSFAKHLTPERTNSPSFFEETTMETAPQHIVTLQPAPDATTLAPSSNDGPRRPRRSVKPVSRLDDIQTAPTVAAARRAPPRSSGSTRRAAPAPSTQKYPRTGRRGAPQVFPRKLYEILTNERSDVIGWTSSGKSFIILEMEIFVNEILMNYFRHQKYSSFQRQLNLYGFRKIQKGPDTGAYAHEHFLRDQPESLTFVRRMPQSQNGMTSSSSSSSLSSLDKAASAGTVGGGGGASSATSVGCPRPSGSARAAGFSETALTLALALTLTSLHEGIMTPNVALAPPWPFGADANLGELAGLPVFLRVRSEVEIKLKISMSTCDCGCGGGPPGPPTWCMAGCMAIERWSRLNPCGPPCGPCPCGPWAPYMPTA